ncbi:MAG TPA: metal-dependent hydrolase [Methanoregula sp.]|nr:metal-dependent hydrolase [Methanoregula sp.]
MLFLGHLVIGLVLGFILYEVFQDKNIIVFCAIGSVLPDLIDKPLGYIIFNSTLSNGKIFFHSLSILILFFIAGLIAWHWFRSNAFLWVTVGVLCHQVVDAMWMYPVTWFYPLLGSFPQGTPRPDYIVQVIRYESSSPTEWIFFIAIAAILVILIVNWSRTKEGLGSDPLIAAKKHELTGGLVSVGLFILALSIIIIYLVEPLGTI